MEAEAQDLGTMLRIGLRLGIPEPSLQALAQLLKEETVFPELKELEAGGGPWLQDLIKTKAEPEIYAMGLFLHWFPQLRKAYEREGLPETVFWDSVQDLGIWCRDRQQKTGLPGLSEWGWVARTYRREVFRIGRLQYEPRALEQDIRLEGRTIPRGTDILEIHIPAECPLGPEMVANSLRTAPDFFRQYFGSDYALGHCHSWLLARELQKLLPERSGILAFQGCFTLYGEDYDFRQAEQRVFGEISRDPRTYPEITGLQKSMKACLLEGKQVGMGRGILDFSRFR